MEISEDTKDFEEHSKSLAKELGIEPESPSKFDIELTDYINGKLSKNHIFDLGTPSEILQKCGFPKDQRIELSASHLDFKAKLQRHPFELSEIKGLDKVLKNPIAVFEYGDRTKSQNVIVNIQKDGKNFLTGIHFNQQKNGFEISSVRTLYPKDNIEWLNWINQGKMIYGNKEKLQALIAQQRMNVADVNSQVAQSPLYEHCLESALNILQDFPAVNDIFTDGNSAYEEIKERAEIEKRFYGYYTEKGNLDARVLAENEALEFYDALKNNNQEKISEYTEHEELHEVSDIAKVILNEYKRAEIPQQKEITTRNQQENTGVPKEKYNKLATEYNELLKDFDNNIDDYNKLLTENEKLRQQLQSRNHSPNSYS